MVTHFIQTVVCFAHFLLYVLPTPGIIESDDISLISLEIEKALNFSKKAAILVESVKKKYGLVSDVLTVN